jgi:hypothetical protein
MTNGELEWIWNQMVVNQSRYYHICLDGLRKTTKNASLADVTAKILNEHLSNTSLERYF